MTHERDGRRARPAPPRDGRPRRPPSVRDASPHLDADGAAQPAAEAQEVHFELDGVVWLARVAGHGAAGTGASGAARVTAVRFSLAAEPERPVREVLVAPRPLDALFPEELVALFRSATPLDPRSDG